MERANRPVRSGIQRFEFLYDVLEAAVPNEPDYHAHERRDVVPVQTDVAVSADRFALLERDWSAV